MLDNFLKTILVLSKLAVCGLLLSISLPDQPAHSGTWRVIPIRLEFDQRARSGVVTITNDSDEKISFSIDAREWVQTDEGKDQYTETMDLLFFPKVLSIDPHTERIIRVGIKAPAVKMEKSYRLFIKQEVPPEERSGTTVAIAIRFGVPIFSKPLVEEVKGAIAQTTIQQGALKIDLRNTGNVHFRVAKIKLSGKNASGAQVFSQELDGGYLLAGTERIFGTVLAEEVCTELRDIDIQVTSDRIHFSGQIDVDKAKCLTP
jgi:fimbrial chaperone protein